MSINKSEILALSIVFFTPIAVTAQVATSAPGASFVESLSASIKAKTNPPAPTPADAVAPQTSPPQAQAQPASPNANKTPEKPVPAAPSAPSAGTPSEKRPVVSNELVTIESLADAQRRALLAKEADLKREASKPRVGAAPVTPPPSVKHMNVPAPKTRHLHAITLAFGTLALTVYRVPRLSCFFSPSQPLHRQTHKLPLWFRGYCSQNSSHCGLTR